MAVDPKLVQALFLQAVELPTADRQAFLDQQCEGDSELREQIETFLLVHDKPDGFLDRPLLPVGFAEPGMTAHPAMANDLAPDARVGPYRIVERLGEGGMGTVWVAEQVVPVKRRVALKVIKPDGGSAQVLARF